MTAINSNLELRILVPGEHRRALVALYREVLSGIVDEEQFRWKYETNPLGPMKVASYWDTSSGELVAAFSAYPRAFLHDGTIVRVFQGADAMVKSSQRGQGLFGKLTDALSDVVRAEGGLFHFGYPNDQSGPIFRRRSDSRVFAVSNAFAFVNGSKDIAATYLGVDGWRARVIDGIGTPLIRSLNLVRGFGRRTPLRLEAVEQFDNSSEAWSRELGRHLRFVPYRDGPFLQWRGLEVPAAQRADTLPFWICEGQERLGYCLLFQDTKRGVLKLIDLLCADPTRNLVRCLELIRWFVIDGGFDAVTTNMSGNLYQAALKRAGFLQVGPPIAGYVVFVDTELADRYPFDGAYWYQAPIDRDNFAY